jgi:hypothetical protein
MLDVPLAAGHARRSAHGRALRAAIWILLAAPFSVFAVVAWAAVKRKRRLDAMQQ